MASISKVIRLSQKLRGVEPSISTLCLGFVGHILAEKSIVSTILTFWWTFYKMAAISMNNEIYFGNYEGYNHNSDLLLYILSC